MLLVFGRGGSCNAISAILIIVECHITYFAGVVSDDFRDFPEASISQNIISMFLREKFDTMIEYLLKILLFLNCEIKSSQDALRSGMRVKLDICTESR